jgi:hypothetical protein
MDMDGKQEEIVINRSKEGKLPTLKIDEDGEMNLVEELVDPYGDIKDSTTGEMIDGAEVTLYFADTARNKAKGYAPGSGVVLPEIIGFEPNNNKSPQQLSVLGKYAYMVFPEADYYLVVKKAGYRTYTSPTIPVEYDIVRHDIQLARVVHTQNPQLPESGAPADVTVNVSANKNKIKEDGTADITIEYRNIGNQVLDSGTVNVILPEGIKAVSTDGGYEADGQVSWSLDDLKPGNSGKYTLKIQAPTLDQAELIAKITAEINAEGDVLNDSSNAKASIKVLMYSDRFGAVEHTRYILGFNDGQFKSKQPLTRAQLAAITARLVNGGGTALKAKYADVPASHWASGYIRISTDEGIFSGYNDGTFHPEAPVTREELAAVMARYLALDISVPVNPHFKDAQGRWSTSSIEALWRNGLVTGYADGSFKPGSNITREEAVVLINHMLFRGPLANVKSSFPDVSAKQWSFGDIEEATHSHQSKRVGEAEELVKWVKDNVQ